MSSPFRYCYHCGSAQLVERSWRQKQCGDCGFHQFVAPTAAAVGLVLDAEDRLLLMRRAHEPGKGKLGLPGGIIEPWEKLEPAASREILEETGVQVPVEAWSYLASFNNRYLFQDYVWPTLDLAVVARVSELPPALETDGEAQEVLWVPLAEVDAAELAFTTHGEMVLELRQRLPSMKSDQPW
jgi:ADP-ribose pyrophosphatase